MKKFFLVLLSVLYCPLVFRGLFQLGMGLPYGGALLNLGYPALAAAYFLLAGMALKRAGIGRWSLWLWMNLLGYPLCWVSLILWRPGCWLNMGLLVVMLPVTLLLAAVWALVGLGFLVAKLLRTPPKQLLRKSKGALAAVWGVLKQVLLVAAVAGLFLGARGYLSLRSPEDYADKGVMTFTASTCYPTTVKSTTSRGRQHSRTVYIVTYKAAGSGYSWTQEAPSKTAGQKAVKEKRQVERRVLSIPAENKYITVEPRHTPESYVRESRARAFLFLLPSAGYLTLCAVWLIWKRRATEDALLEA